MKNQQVIKKWHVIRDGDLKFWLSSLLAEQYVIDNIVPIKYDFDDDIILLKEAIVIKGG